ncbi:hypothetical protein C922_00780 [Plasmodium inui San Antonio 1]|uniref:Uncharacterized protein n=1 Tax=Plasmodium inui San Antonio 1 TaxID=1237626 RepID=W7ACR5_9APIC|nr:hypothetical protein C922_00780 [Plasmodium inui San Antonio 1]EUD69088.1 hypothetical protein C922_00780 [Plasmodium inui San Antonio 1]
MEEGLLEGKPRSPPYNAEYYENLIKRERNDSLTGSCHQPNEASGNDGAMKRHPHKREENKSTKNEKNKCIIFSTLLRYKKYLTKKGNTYFDFNQTNLMMNEKELLLQSSNYFHLFDISSLFYPHVYVNVHSHMSVNISDYLNYVKRVSPEEIEGRGSSGKDPPVKQSSVEATPILQYATRQEFIMEAIQKVEHIEVFKKVQLVKKLLLTVNREVAQKVETYVDNILEVNPNDYIFVQTNRKNDLLFGYVKSSKFNLIFEIFNFNKFFKKCHEDNVDITVHEVKDKGSDEQSFVERLGTEGGIYLKEQSIHVKRDVYQNVKFCSAHYCYYYFFKNAPVKCIFEEGKSRKKIFTFSLCVKYVKNHLFVMMLFNYSPPREGDKHCVNAEAAVPDLDEIDTHNKQFNLNETDKNVFKRNTFFVHHLYDELKCKLLSLISFVSFPPNDYIADIHLTKLNKCNDSSPGGYSFSVYCLSNGGVVYIFIFTMMIDNLCKDSFQLHVNKYYHFELRRKDTYQSVKVVKCSSGFLGALCGGGPQRRTKRKVNRKRTNSPGEQSPPNNKWEIPHTLEEETIAPLQSDNLCEARGNIICSRTSWGGNKPTHASTQMEKYKYLFLIITSKCDFFIVTFRRKKKGGDIELVNYSCTNSTNRNEIIRGVLVNKHHFGKADEGEKGSKGKTAMGQTTRPMHHQHRIKQPNGSFSIFELLCYFQDGGVKKYNFVCTAKEQHLEFFLTKNEMPRGELLCKKQFFIPILFPFNEEVLKKGRKQNDNSVTLYNTQASYFKSIFFIYFQEKQYENVSLCVNDQCLVITYVKSVCDLLRQIRAVMGRARSSQGELHSGADLSFHDQVDILETGRKSNPQRSDAHLPPDERTNFLAGETLNGNLFTHREHKTHFWEYKYILFGFYDLFLINQNNSTGNDGGGNVIGGNVSGGNVSGCDVSGGNASNKANPGVSEKEKRRHPRDAISEVNAYDAHSHFNFLNIVKDYLSYDALVGGVSNAPSGENRRKIKMNFYHFLQTLSHFQENYVSEGNSFFHLIFNELFQKNVYPAGANRTKAVGRETLSVQLHPLLDIRTHFCVLFSFFIHMYNFCLKQNGISSDSFSSHITYFLISKKTRRNRKRFRYVYEPESRQGGDKTVDYDDDANGKADGNADDRVGQNEHLQMSPPTTPEATPQANLLAMRKCLYYISKAKKYLHSIFRGGAGGEDPGRGVALPHVYTNLYLCQVVYIMLNTLRINNTNVFVNVNYDLRKNNMDYFYLLILLNVYCLHSILISHGAAQNPLSGGDGEEDLHQFFYHIFQREAIPSGGKTDSTRMEGVEIDQDTFERHQVLIHDFIRRLTSRLRDDHYVIERTYFKINCVLCGKVSLSNLYNHYYICEQKHIFNKCMLTLCCIGKSSLVIPNVYLSRDLSKSVFEEPIDTLQFNLRVKLDCPYFCSFCHLFVTTQNRFFSKHFLFKQCPFCNHHLVAV